MVRRPVGLDRGTGIDEMLTSVRHPKVAAALRLRRRGHREEDRRFLVEGAQPVGAALDAGELLTLFTTDDLDPLAVRASQAGVETLLVTDAIVRRLTSTVTPQPIVGVASFIDVELTAAIDAATPPGGGCIVLLHEVRDPGNAGTVVRSADAAGAGGVVFTEASVDAYNPKTVRASAGSVFHLPIVREASTIAAIDAAKERNIRVLAMTTDGSHDLYSADLGGAVAFLLGNEVRGLPPRLVEAADETVRVPRSGRAESLNLAAAATVCLFEWQRRRLHPGEALEEIIAAAAHDIRSPLTAMKGFGYALERRWGEMTEEQRALMLRGIVHDADRMDTILRQLVDAARVVGGNLEPFKEQVEVDALVRSIADHLARDPDHPPVVWSGGRVVAFVDPARLRTTLLAFTGSLVWWGSGGPIEVEGAIRDGVLRVRAERACDELDPASVEGLFAPRRPGEGAGSKIGLFVARGVAQAQGGRCWAEVAHGRLAFHLELPAQPP